MIDKVGGIRPNYEPRKNEPAAKVKNTGLGSDNVVISEEAARAADAAKNTATLIESTVQAVGNGNELTNLTRDSFADNMEIAGKINQLVNEISESCQEQAQGIDQVSKAISQMDDVSQRNAANSEESAAAAEEMNSQAVMINSYIKELVLVCEGDMKTKGDRGKVASVEGKFKPRDMPSSKGKDIMPKASRLRPEQIIPFDDDLKDF